MPTRPRSGTEDDVDAARMDDRARLRQFVEGMRERLIGARVPGRRALLPPRLQPRRGGDALGVEPKRMEKIMDGVSKKVGAFVHAIEAGSLVRGAAAR